MPALDNPQYEKFAKKRAEGASVAAAAEYAGFSPTSGHGWDLDKDEKVKARVQALRDEAATLRLVEPPALIKRLLAIADRAETLDSAAGMAAARAALMDAARLSGVLEASVRTDGAVARSEPVVLADHPLSEEEWTRVLTSGA